MVNGSSNRNNNFSENLFSKNNVEQNVVNSINGATALKLDESFEIKNNEEQNAVIESFESDEENKVTQNTSIHNNTTEEIPSGVSIESASYMENNSDIKIEDNLEKENSDISKETGEEEYTPKLFSDDQNHFNHESNTQSEHDRTEQLFEEDVNEEEDFEIPAFLRRQKF